MTDQSTKNLSPRQASERVALTIKARMRKESQFLFIGQSAVAVAMGFLILLFAGILSKGIPGFFQHYVTLEVQLDAAKLDPTGKMTIESLTQGDFDGAVRDSLYLALGNPEGRKAKRDARKLIDGGIVY